MAYNRGMMKTVPCLRLCHWSGVVAMLLSGISCTVRADVGQPLNSTAFKSNMEIVFSGYAGTTTLADLPVLVILNTSIPEFDYAQFLDGAADLRFTDASDIELAYEIEEWNPSSSSYIWVRMPQLQNNTDLIRVYWGNPNATAPAYGTAVWNAGYRGVWHMNQTSPTDSTVLANHGVGGNTVATQGKAAGALDFDGSAYVDINAVANDISSANISISALIRTSSDGGLSGMSAFSFVTERLSLGGVLRLMVNVGPEASTGAGEVGVFQGTTFNNLVADTNTRVDDGQWRHVAYSRDGSVGRIYVDGVEKASHDASFAYAATDRWSIGQTWGGNTRTRYFLGQIDEVRVSDTPRSADWIAASAKMLLTNNQFMTYRAVETTPVLGTILFGW